MDRLRYGHRRVSRAAGDGSRNVDTQEQTLEGVGIRPELIYRDVASGGRSERAGGYRSPLRHHHGQPPGPHARNLVEGLQMIERLTEQGFGIVALDAGIDTSAANPAARLQIAMMLVSRAAAKRTTGVMPDGHGLAGWAGGLAWSGAGAGLGRALIGGWPIRRWR